MTYTQIDPFWALGDPIRRRIVDILASGEHTAGEVADVVNAEFRVSRTSASKHLRVLRDAGLVDVRADEQWRWYRLLADGVDVLEYEVADLRRKMTLATGWDADSRSRRDPLRGWARPPRKGPGRDPRPGRRGAQTARILVDGPDDWMPSPWFTDRGESAYPLEEQRTGMRAGNVHGGDGDATPIATGS